MLQKLSAWLSDVSESSGWMFWALLTRQKVLNFSAEAFWGFDLLEGVGWGLSDASEGAKGILCVRDCSVKPGTSKASEDLQRKARPQRGHALILIFLNFTRRQLYCFLIFIFSSGNYLHLRL
jgi:hypothetical protein